MRFILGLLLLVNIAFGQTCNVCPAGNKQLLSGFPTTAAHSWSCTNGLTSTLQNPTFNFTSDCQCTVTATENGCTVTNTLNIDVCDCSCNAACIAGAHNPSTDCVNITTTGTSCSTILTDVLEWKKNTASSWTTTTSGSNICGCNIYEQILVTPTCNYVSGSFRFGYNATICAGSTINNVYWIPYVGSTTTIITSSTSTYVSLSTTEIINGGGGGILVIRNATPLGTILAKIQFNYDGSGTACTDITSTVLQQTKAYYDINLRRTQTFSGGCPNNVCTTTLDIPNQPDDCLLDGYITTSNLSAPCSGSGLSATNFFAGTAPLTYNWTYNGTTISGATASSYCLVGQPNGIYCVNVTDANGCEANDCRNVQPACSLTASIANSGTTMTATITNCTGTPTYQWQKYTSGSWVNVGANFNSYNHNGVEGDYRVIVTCTGCTAVANYTYIIPCSITVTGSISGTDIVATVTGCALSKTYTLERSVSGVWTLVASTTVTANSVTLSTGNVTGIYRVKVVGCNCEASTILSYTASNPCNSFTSTFSGSSANLCNGSSRSFSITPTGGTTPYTYVWRVNGTIVGTNTNSYTYTATTNGTYTVSCQVTDANSCVTNQSVTFSVVTCCSFSLSVSPTTITKCVNESHTFTATPTGGNSPYTYNWTSTLSGGNPINQGSGATKTLSFATAETYTIQATGTDNNGCVATASSTMTVTTCTNCTCTPLLTLANCQLTGTFSGGGCSNFTYQLQYSLTATGWSQIQSGTATGTVNYAPTANGYYRLAISAVGCNTGTVSDVYVGCYVSTCSNPPTLTLNGTSQTVCGQQNVTVAGNTFGGSATQTQMFVNGNGGLVSPGTVTTSPFSWTYNAVAGDIGNTVTISGVTNNPLGPPCQAVTRQYVLNYVANPTSSITSSNANLCNGSTRSLTGSPTGGVFSIVSGPATIANNVLTATNVGSVVIQYLVTNSNGCTATSTQTIPIVAKPSVPTASVTCSNGLGTLTVTSPTGASFQYSINNGTYQTSPTFTNLANGSYVVKVKNTDNCEESATVSVSCQSCSCTASIAANASCLLTLTQTCSGYSWIWEQSNDGLTGWSTVATSGTTYQGLTGKYYRVTLSKATCPNVVTNIVQVSCACQGFTMDVSTLPGRLTFGTLKYNGSSLTNYRIQWKKCSDNSIVFESGMGNGAGSGVYSHPFSNLPLPQGCYYPYILTSDQGNNLDCFDDANITNWTCPVPPSYSYEGPGGTAATREFAMDINPSTTHVKIESFVVFTVPDNLEVIYNGVTLYNSSNNIASNTPVYIPITYTASDPDVLFRITNQTPTQTTKWNIGNISCCSGLQPCPTISDVPSVSNFTTSINNSCNCLFVPTFSTFSNTCRNCHHSLGNYGLGGCIYSVQNNSTCLGNGNIVVTKPNNTTRVIDFDNSTMYTTWKSYVQGVNNIDYRINVQFQSVDCGNDGSLYNIQFFPNRTTITWDDVNFTQTIVVSTANPYSSSCAASNCSGSYYNEYQTMINQFANTTAVGTHRSIKLRQIQWYNTFTQQANTPFTSRIDCTTYPCTTTLEKKYNIFLRDVNCPCQSWQLFYDADNNGTYETLVTQASGWTGTCQ